MRKLIENHDYIHVCRFLLSVDSNALIYLIWIFSFIICLGLFGSFLFSFSHDAIGLISLFRIDLILFPKVLSLFRSTLYFSSLYYKFDTSACG